MFAFIFCLSLLTVDFKKNIFEHDTIVVQIVNKKFMNMNTLIKDLNFKCFIQMTSKTDSVDHVKKVCLIRKFVHDANMYSTVLFNVCNERYVIPQFEYRKNRIMFWFINVLFSTDVLFYLTSFEQQLWRYKQNEQKQRVHSLEPLFVQ